MAKPIIQDLPVGPFSEPTQETVDILSEYPKIYNKNGDSFVGSLNNRKKRDGYGIFVFGNHKNPAGYEYHGPWNDGVREGKGGLCFFYNEEFYIGDWLSDMRHGAGEHFYVQNEERYIGDWR